MENGVAGAVGGSVRGLMIRCNCVVITLRMALTVRLMGINIGQISVRLRVVWDVVEAEQVHDKGVLLVVLWI